MICNGIDVLEKEKEKCMRCYRDVLFIIQHWFKLQPTTSEARKDVVLFTSWTASQKYGEICVESRRTKIRLWGGDVERKVINLEISLDTVQLRTQLFRNILGLVLLFYTGRERVCIDTCNMV